MGADVNQPLIPRRAAEALAIVEAFFGIDPEWNRHIFRHAANVDQRAFETTICALAQAVEIDSRRGMTERIKRKVQQERAGR
ncbi:MAG: hypothetical protein PHD19_09460 [Dechloromonas sp.]|nr:hypothetical protein [Dechloromonas sp.]